MKTVQIPIRTKGVKPEPSLKIPFLPVRHALAGCRRLILASSLATLLSLPIGAQAQSGSEPSASYKILMQDILINADLWSATPEILSAGYGFEGIIGVDGNKEAVLAAHSAWLDLPGYENPPLRSQTSSPTPDQVATNFGYSVELADAMPIVFSWPVLPSTVTAEAFRIELNTGEIVTPAVVSISPNLEYNERNTIVMFGEFGNRLTPGTEGAIYPVKVTIVKTSTPMKLVGPNGPVSAVGLEKESTHPYTPNGGPTLVGAKLTTMSTLGEGAPPMFSSALPNHGEALYGEDAQYRLRMLTTGGFSRDGVSSVFPTDFSTHFRLRVVDLDDQGNEIIKWITEVGVPLSTSQGSITVVGLADLGPWMSSYDLTYQEDHDNQIDIILKGDEAAMRLLTHIEIPATGEYLPFYNPGGPGEDLINDFYTKPGPYTLQPIMIAIDDPFTVTYMVPEPSLGILGALAAAALAVMAKGGRGRRMRRLPDVP